MSESFDPYYKWLGISPVEQPPNHYRLLGLNLYESDLDVIANGSERQMRHLRSFQIGPRVRDCQRLLNEVAGARMVLLDSQKKAAYDQTLRATLTPAEAPPPANWVPLTPADTLLPTPPAPAAPTTPLPLARAATTAAVKVAKGTRHPHKQPRSVATLVGGVVIGLVAVLACGYGISLALKPNPRPIESQAARPADVDPALGVKTAEPGDPPGEPELSAPVADASLALRPANALVDALDEYDCTSTSQPRLAIDGSFDATKSWRLSMRVNASAHPDGTLFCWGDSRAGKDPICIKASASSIEGWVLDNTRSDKPTALPKIPIDWSAWNEIELVHDAVSQVLQLRVGDRRQNVSVAHPPRPDRDMPVHLGGLGMGSLHAYPCWLRDVRLEQLTDPVNLVAPTMPVADPAPKLVTAGEPTGTPTPPGTLGDLVKPSEVSRLAVPDQTELQAARDQLQRFFENDLNKQRTPQEAGTFADQLVAQAIEPSTQPATRYVLFEIAIDLAAQGGAVASASRAFQELDKAFLVDLVQLKADAALKIARHAKEPWEHKAVAELLEVVIDECLAVDRYDVAMPLAEAALEAARKSKDSSSMTRIATRSRDVKTANIRYEPVRAALAVVTGGSDDPAAHETIGRHLCLAKGNWNAGLPHLVKSGTSELRDVAARDIRNPSNSESQSAVADDWLRVALQLDRSLQQHAFLRAEHWYRLALAQESGLKKLPLEAQINELGKKLGELAELPSGAVLVMTFEPSTLKRRGYVLDVSQHGYVGVVHGAVFADGIAGNALAFDGKDSYVEVASTPWLSAPPAFSLAAWVNVVSWKDPQNAVDYVLSNESAGERGYVLRYRTGGNVNLTLGVSQWYDALSTNKASLGLWHHMAATFDGQTASVFLDGELEGTQAMPRPISPSTVPFRIGQGAHRKDRGVRGFIDEVAIFNRALSPEEVRTVYRIGRAGRPLME